MGTWALDPFGNDTACDWKYDLEETSGLELIRKTLEPILKAGDSEVDASEADQAIAAADTIARLRGHFYVRNGYTESLDEWVAKQTVEVPPSLVDQAIQTVDRIMQGPSELAGLWEESGELEEWQAEMESLKGRLKLPPVNR